MLKIGVLGGGISGLSIAKMLKDDFEVEVFEKSSEIGGIAKTIDCEGVAYHLTGGHCFNSKHKEVLDFVFGEIMPEANWHKIKRNAVINFMGNKISYPIEFSIKEIFSIDQDLAISMIRDFINVVDDFSYINLDDWFRKKFGNTLAEKYFLPYNKKIWNRDPKEMNPNWVEGKLPIPNKNSFFKALLENEKDKMPHFEFYYPNSNNQNTFIEKLAEGLVIKLNSEIRSLEFDKTRNKWVINNNYYFDYIISTLPLDVLPKIIIGCPDSILKSSESLKYNQVTTMLWKSRPTEFTWTYLPEPDTIFHRYIHIGNFFAPQKNFTISEAVGSHSFDEMCEFGKKDSFLIEPVGYHVSNHAYVVFDDKYEISKKEIQDYLSSIGLFSLGRFGEWEYYNMDICIKSALNLKKNILTKKII